MPPTAESSGSLMLICGDDEFAVKQRALRLFEKWCEEEKAEDREIIDASVNNSGEALKALAKLREALQTLPFFGGSKVVWLKNCNFLGDERAAEARAVTDDLTDLAQELKQFDWRNVRLLISAGKVDKRKTFYKTIDKAGKVETFAGWSVEDKDWQEQAENWALRELSSLKKEISDEALASLVACVGPNARQLHNEVEKLALYVGNRSRITPGDVESIVTRNKQARAFALGDAFGDRDLPRLLRCLDEELWEMKTDRNKSEIGLLYALIGKVRTMIFMKEMVKAGWIKADVDYSRFKAQLDRVPADAMPEDRKLNPLAAHPFVLFKTLPQLKKYTQEELVMAMDLLLSCNRQLVSTGAEAALVLQQTLTRIVKAPANPVTGSAGKAPAFSGRKGAV